LSEPAKQHPVRNAILGFLAVIVLAGALYCGFLFYTTVRAIVAQTDLPFAPKVVQAGQVPDDAPPVQPGQDLPEIVEQQERINILLLGIDQRKGDAGPWRTDTMILVSVDPATRSAAMISIPRDLWVTIPGYGESRINMAHYLGDANDYPGGGVALAKKTAWYALGVPVHYYARINFGGFERLVDAIGGLTINVETAIHDENYPDGSYGTMVLDIPAGVQHMDGRTALQYARSRHGTGDFDRMARQQNVILAARDKILSANILLSSLPKMLEIAGDSVKTDLTLEQMFMLAELAQNIQRDNIKHGVIDDSMTTTVVTPQGWMVEVADWDMVRQMIDDLFPAPMPSAVPTPSLAKAQLVSEKARIVVQNGTLITDLAKDTAESLRNQGFNVIRYENADRFDHQQTRLVAYSDKPYTISTLAQRFGISDGNIYDESSMNDVDIVIVIGRDLAQSKP